MQKATLLTWFILGILLLPSMGHGQYFHVQRIGVRQGLASANTYSVYEDREGYLWVGSDLGASRYDGYSFVNYSAAGPQRLGQVNVFAEIANGQLLAGSAQGLFYHANHQFRHLPVTESGVTDLVFDHEQNLWLASEAGVFYLSKQDLDRALTGADVTATLTTGSTPEFEDDPRTTDLHLGSDGELYAATYFYLMAFRNGQWARLWGRDDHKPDIVRIAETKAGTLALACEAGQFLQWEAGEVSGLAADLYFGLDVQYHQDRLLLLTYDQLAILQDDQLNIIIDADEELPEWMRSFCLDRHGTIWIATFEGLLKVQSTAFHWFKPEAFPETGDIYSFGEDHQGRLLLGANRGLVYVRQDSIFAPYYPTQDRLFPSAEIFAIHRRDADELWFGSGYQGIVREKNSQFRRFTDIGGLGDDARFFFLSAPDGSLWAGGDGGVDCLQFTEQGDSVVITDYHYDTGSPQYASFYDGLVAADGSLWFVGNFGLFQIQNNELQPSSIKGFSEAQFAINDLVVDQDGHLWLATSSFGILYCSYQNDQWQLEKQFDQSAGLNSDAFLSLLVDDQGTLWAGNYIGLCRISTDGHIRCYDEKDGFIDRSYTNLRLFQAEDQQIWAGSTEGVITFDPDSLRRNELPPKMHLEGVELFNGRESAAPYLSRTPDPASPNLRLPYDQNHLSFRIAGINLSQPDKTRFRHRLLGQGPEWTYASYQPNFTYPKLSPGDYIFEIQAANEDGIWSDPLLYHFIIRPPFWQRWWFYALLSGLAVGIIYLIFRAQHRRNLNKRQVIESKLQALRAQMNPHFLSNALNAINYFILDNNAFAASRYLTKFSRLIRLILDHSQSAHITLGKELEALDLYLELEKLRYEDKFDFQIDVHEDISPQLVLIPPLIIQPFAENAVWHGFMNQTVAGQLCIRIFPENGLLKCTIQDNGIGRAAARAHQRSRGKAPGQGHQLTSNRLQLLLKETPTAQAVRIIDLTDENGQAQGTRVEISLPLVFVVN